MLIYWNRSISALFSQTRHFEGETSGGMVKCRLFSQAKPRGHLTETTNQAPKYLAPKVAYCSLTNVFTPFFITDPSHLNKGYLWIKLRFPTLKNMEIVHSGHRYLTSVSQIGWRSKPVPSLPNFTASWASPSNSSLQTTFASLISQESSQMVPHLLSW